MSSALIRLARQYGFTIGDTNVLKSLTSKEVFDELIKRFDGLLKNINQVPQELHQNIRTKTITTPLIEFINNYENEIDEAQMNLETEYFDVRDAFDTDRLIVEKTGRGSETTLKRIRSKEESKLGEAQDKIAMSREHYRFLKSVLDPKLTITSSNSLLGNKGVCTLFGRLGRHIGDTSQNNSLFWFEDLDGRIRIDAQQWTSLQSHGFGILTEGTFLLCSGEFDADEQLFLVRDLQLPQLDQYLLQKLKQNHHLATFGLSSREVENLIQIEDTVQESESIVILQDVHLDNPNVMRALGTFFEGYAQAPPSIFLFIGSFTSKDHQHFSRKEYKTLFQDLALLITTGPGKVLLDTSMFVFVTGPNDPALGANSKLFPRGQIPNYFIKSFKEKLGSNSVHFTSNPCHIRFLSRHITVFRDDLLQKMTRHSIVHPDEQHPLDVHLCKTIYTNAHLAPLDQTYHPSIWKYEHAMRLIPTPDAVILADRCPEFVHTENDVHFVNPSSFSRHFSFVQFYPLENRSEFRSVK